MRAFLDDLRNGWRRVIRQPGASIGVVALLALAIGVTSAMFTVVDAFIVRPVPFQDPSRLAQVALRTPVQASPSPSAPRPILVQQNFPRARAWRDSGVFEAVHGVMTSGGEIIGPKRAIGRNIARVTPGTFEMLGVTPILGRTFAVGEGRDGNEGYAAISESVWRDLFDADPGVIGMPIEAGGVKAVVVGVMPASLRFPIRGDGVWLPLDLDVPAASQAKRPSLTVYVRLKRGMPRADAALVALTPVRALVPANATIELRPASGGLLDAYSREAITALAIGVGLVFIVLCANATNLILARTSARRQEFGVCAAIGASRGRLLRQVFLENSAIGVLAAALGLGLAFLLVALAKAQLPAEILWRTLNPLDVDVRAVVATSVAGLLATLVAGLPPAWLGTKTNTSDSLRLGTRGGTDTRHTRRLTRGLLLVEVAMAVSLLASAGLQARSFVNLVDVDRGVDSRQVVVASVSLPPAHFADRPSRAAFAGALVDRAGALPGVERAALAQGIPPSGGDIHDYPVQPDLAGAAPVPLTFHGYQVAPDFFYTYGVSIRQGRGFVPGDAATDIVISEHMAKAVFGNVSPLGHSVTFGKQALTIVGVSEEVRTADLDPRSDWPEFYQNLYAPSGSDGAGGIPGSSRVTLGLRCSQACPSIESVRETIRQANANATISSVRLLSDDYMTALARPRVAAIIALSFAGLALFAAAAGLYGVLGYVVSRRKREFGIRAAMGAQPGALGRSVLLDGVRVSVGGVVLGVAAGWALSRWLGSVQFGVTFFDPFTWAAVIVTVLAMSAVASFRPARQAMRVDPVALLRED